MRSVVALTVLLAACADRPLDTPFTVDIGLAAYDASTLDASHTNDLATSSLRLIAPLSTSTVTSHRPTLRWRGSAALVDLCLDRACTASAGSATIDGDHARPDAPLFPGNVFWRVRSADGSATPIWEFHVGVVDAQIDSSSGTRLDINGDGQDDVAIGELGGGADPGAAHVYFGGASGPMASSSVDIPAMDDQAELLADFQVSNAGDLDGDGYGDLAVSSVSRESASPAQPGIVRVYYGAASGFRADVTVLQGSTPGDQFGRIAAGIGDLNGDGYGDLLVGAFDGVTPPIVLLGGPGGVDRDDPSRVVSLPAPLVQNGNSDSGSCDFNGDGYADILIGSPDETTSTGGSGRGYVYFGGPDGISSAATIDSPDIALHQFAWTVTAGDVDGDGYGDAILAEGNHNALYIYAGSATGLASTPLMIAWPADGYSALAIAGDVNSDGRQEVLLGGQGSQVYLYLGGSNELVPVGAPDAGLFGYVIAGVGNVDGVGTDDIVVGAPFETPGHAYIFDGNLGGLSATPPIVLAGRPNVDTTFAYSVAGLR